MKAYGTFVLLTISFVWFIACSEKKDEHIQTLAFVAEKDRHKQFFMNMSPAVFFKNFSDQCKNSVQTSESSNETLQDFNDIQALNDMLQKVDHEQQSVDSQIKEQEKRITSFLQGSTLEQFEAQIRMALETKKNK